LLHIGSEYLALPIDRDTGEQRSESVISGA
jgi:hypothetical protein